MNKQVSMNVQVEQKLNSFGKAVRCGHAPYMLLPS